MLQYLSLQKYESLQKIAAGQNIVSLEMPLSGQPELDDTVES